MSCDSTVTINGKVYQRVDDGKEAMHICIVDNRGLTFVGRCDLSGDPDDKVLIRGARCIIRWGTSGHLAELCDGPKENTKLGVARDFEVQCRRNIIGAYRVNEKGWTK